MSVKDKLKPITKTRRIVTVSALSAVIAVLIAVICVANYFIGYYSLIINRFFAGDNVDAGNEQSKAVFELADDVVRSAAEESMVLLKNKEDSSGKGFLPLPDLKKVNLFGYGSTDNGFLLSGGGSGGTTITDEKDIKIDLDDAFIAEGIEINTELYNAYKGFSDVDSDFGSTGANAVEKLVNPGGDFYTATLMKNAKTFSSVAVAVLSRWGVENGGHGELKDIEWFHGGAYLELTNEERAMFDKLRENKFDVIVVLNVCNNIELGFLEEYDNIKACIFAGIPGQSGAVAIPRIITGKVDPSGRTSDTLPYDYQTYNPVYENAVKRDDNLVYQEGIYFGYKWYETADAEHVFDSAGGYDKVVQFPFGYGLSYTKFDWQATFPAVTALEQNGQYEVKVKVKNTGKTEGKDVVELYGHTDYIGGIEKAEVTLLDFAKTPLLKPEEECEVTLKFSTYDLASYDEYDKNGNRFTGYELDGGDNNVEITVRRNAHDRQEALAKKYSVPQIKYATDPKTGAQVGNLFTGSKAYAKCPIDGRTAYGSEFEYLSRKNGFANYSAIKSVGAPANGGVVDAAVAFTYRGYDKVDVSDIEYGVNSGLYLVRAVKKDSEGKETYSRATLAQLNGEDTSVELGFNTKLLELLNDYDSPVWDLFLNQLTQAEIKDLIGKGGFMTCGLASVGKTRCTDKDGPAGYNNNVTNPGKSSIYTLYPSESLLGCSWSRDIAYAMGEAQGKIGSELGINGWYGPGVNLHRSVYNSRNYEYFSEDATLSGKLASSVISGAKDNNVYCYLKHMAVSEAGQNPKELNTWLTEQALRECYLRPFEIAVKNGDANAIMSAFNRVGAVLAGYNHAMLTDVLRGEWGFRGSVITDWYDGGGYMSSHKNGVLGGNDLWLCGSTAQPAAINLASGGIAYAARLSAKNILYTYVNTYSKATTIKVNPEPHSDLFAFLWTMINVLLGIGIAVCALFITLAILRRTAPPPQKAPAAAFDTAGPEAEELSESSGELPAPSEPEQAEQPAAAAELETWTCPSCGAQMKDTKKFCTACGTKRPAPEAAAEQNEPSEPEQPTPEQAAEAITETAAEQAPENTEGAQTAPPKKPRKRKKASPTDTE